jgi:hypothetical protein
MNVTFENYICGERFQKMADFEFQPGHPVPNENGILFCKSDYLAECLEAIRNSPKRFILISHNSDLGPTQELADKIPDNLVAWYAQNCNAVHPRLSGIPIGISNPEWWCGDFGPILKLREEKIQAAKGELINYFSYIAYSSFKTGTNQDERSRCEGWFESKNWCYKSGFVDRNTYLNNIARSLFVISPPGNGIDCCRHWESLYLGSIPIIKKSHAMSFFTDLPILMVDDWNQVTTGFIMNSIINYSEMRFSLKKLDINYWKEKISSCKTKYLSV